ncbi:MAG: hypothetical protein ABIS08_09280 [Pseudolysinimonas sp.]
MTEPVTGLLRWLPRVGGILVLGIVGSVLGVAGAFGHPTSNVTVAHPGSIVVQTVGATSCPGGPVVTNIPRGSHVLALARSADSSAVQVRNPANTPQLVWIGLGSLKANTSQPAVATLPVGNACPVLTVIQPAPVVVTPVTPVIPPKPKPKDTTPPSVATPVIATNENCHVVVTVTATDNVGVTGVTIVLSGVNSGSHAMTFSGGHWQYVLQQPPVFSSGSTTFTVTAQDAAGHSSSQKSVSASVQCLI